MRLLAIVLIGLFFSCKTAKTNSTQSASTDGGASASVLNQEAGASGTETSTIPNAPGMADSPFILTGDGESIVAVDPQAKAAFEAEMAASSTATATDTSTASHSSSFDPSQLADQVVENIGIVLAAFAGGGLTVGSIVYVKNALSHEGGLVAYFLKPFSRPYFEWNYRANERAILAGTKPAYNSIVDFSTGVTVNGKNKTLLPSSPLINANEILERTIYLGVLPTDSVVSGKINDYLTTKSAESKGSPPIDWKSIETVSVVEDFEAKKISSNLTINQVASPDNDPVSIGRLEMAARYQEDILLRGSDVYVHCKSGVGRSAEAVAVFLIRNYGLTATEAGAYVKSIRSTVRVGEPHVHQRAIEDYELFHTDIIGGELQNKMKEYNINKTRWNKINDARMTAGKDPLRKLEL